MSPENELKLSFYQDVTVLDQAHDIRLVKHVETGTHYVRKTLSHYDLRVIEVLKSRDFAGIPRIHETVEEDGRLIVIEDYIRGDSLDKVLEKMLLDPSEAISVINRLCRILAPLHAYDPAIIHRDIKASNVILAENGDLYLIDFDAAKLHDPGKNRDTVLIGTEDYAAPEQYGFAQSDRQTDIYALGVLLNTMVTGHVPVEGLAAEPLGSIVTKCTQMDPRNRYQDVEQLEAALKKAASKPGHENPAAKSDDTPKRLPFYRHITGFKSGKAWVAAVAILWYILITYACLTIENVDANGKPITGFLSWSSNIALWLVFILETLYLGNSFGWRDRSPYQKKPNTGKIANIIRILIGAALILLGMAFLNSVSDLIYKAYF